MIYLTITKDNVILYQGEDKDQAIEVKKTNPRAFHILYQPEPDGDKFILRENH